MSAKQKFYIKFTKRVADIAFSLLALVLLSPILLFCLIATKATSKGPAIFKQERPGLHEKSFVLYKFRSMKVGAPQVGAEDLTKTRRFAIVTKWGAFMRKTSLDELPQLVNILKGDMSFIGPRPGLTMEGEPALVMARRSYIPSAYDVKPGLSGYSQIKLKRNPDVNLRAQYDSYYVKHISMWLDIKLFALSLLSPILNIGK